MTEREPLPITARYAVVATGDVGVLVDVLEMEELLPFWPALWALIARRPRCRWRATWMVIEFPNGTQGAYRRSELEARHV